MPYITSEDRAALEIFLEDLISSMEDTEMTAGTMNYLFTRLAHAYLDSKELNYQHINDMIGALEGAKQELYRRVAVPYEDKKIIENGDVLPESLEPETVVTRTDVFTFQHRCNGADDCGTS